MVLTGRTLTPLPNNGEREGPTRVSAWEDEGQGDVGEFVWWEESPSPDPLPMGRTLEATAEGAELELQTLQPGEAVKQL